VVDYKSWDVDILLGFVVHKKRFYGWVPMVDENDRFCPRILKVPGLRNISALRVPIDKYNFAVDIIKHFVTAVG
jgi:hypothetical protein